ncbi:transposase [Bacteroidetes bacterium UKL13-3]|jgi:transposase-like protein|nr:transposase [Bacteroidetes bacterium UKL13-3]
MKLINFIKQFPDEQSCKEHFRLKREQEGISCKECGCTKHYWLKAKYQWQCSRCDFRTTLRSGTIMEHAKLPFQKWYMAMAFMSLTKKGISATELQKQMDHSRYASIWNLMHKIREAMGKRDSLYTLTGMIEMDEGYFEKATPEGTKLKRGKGSQKQQNVAVLAESTPLENLDTGITSKHCRYFKMQVLNNHKSDAINSLFINNIEDSSIVFTDKSTSYVDIADYVEVHVSEVSTEITTNTTLKWVHIAIANAKRMLLGIYHKIKGLYLQNYLNEFCYKLNRRYFGDKLFDRLTLAVAKTYW